MIPFFQGSVVWIQNKATTVRDVLVDRQVMVKPAGLHATTTLVSVDVSYNICRFWIISRYISKSLPLNAFQN